MKTETPLIDNFGRPLNYLRLAVTDRCNLRCLYCMPAGGIEYIPQSEILTYEEMERLVRLVVRLGVRKLRITGGEPFVRRNIMGFLRRVAGIPGLEEIHMTTNGVLTAPFVPELKRIGICGINLSLDAVDREAFRRVTRRDEFERVWASFQAILAHGIRLKINAVIQQGMNEDQIVPLARLARDYPVAVRFIEEMPFNGSSASHGRQHWDYARLLAELQRAFPDLKPLPGKPHTTAREFSVPGFQGTLGIIAGYSRLFCDECNRMRITARGLLKLCLYDTGVLNLKEMLRSGADDEQLAAAIRRCAGRRFANGFQAEAHARKANPAYESMSEIGG